MQPDVLVCRTEHPMGPGLKDKTPCSATWTPARATESRDAETIYDVPALLMQDEALDEVVLEKLGITTFRPWT